MRRTTHEHVTIRIESCKLARFLSRMGPPITSREVRAIWTATDKRFGGGRYRWYRKYLRAELASYDH